jgi:hypothetical protein
MYLHKGLHEVPNNMYAKNNYLYESDLNNRMPV